MITFYYRPQCGLCREIEGPLMQYATQYRVRVKHVNIDEDKAAFTLYWDKIPVIEIAGGPTFFEPISRDALRKAISNLHSPLPWAS
jgi:thiol-disulfide isomerase/thioredoxin